MNVFLEKSRKLTEHLIMEHERDEEAMTVTR